MNDYNTAFYDTINDGSFRSARRFLATTGDDFYVKSVIDVGCGEGAWLAAFQEIGSEIVGIDGDYVDRSRLLIPEDRFISMDLKELRRVPGEFDLVISLEVAEHLPESSANQFVKGLCLLADRILFSAAIPGQTGAGHINCQWPSYWVEKFMMNDFHPQDYVRWNIWNDKEIEPWYRQNMLVFENDHIMPMSFKGNVVHPEIYAWKL